MINDIRRLTDTLKIDSKAVNVLTFEMNDGTIIRSGQLLFIESVIDVIRDTRPIWSGRAGEREILLGHLPPLVSGEVVLRFRMMADMGGNIITITTPLKWWQRLEWKLGYALGYLQGLVSRPKPDDKLFDFPQGWRQ